MHRQFLRLLTLCLVILFALPALGQYTRDAAANRKIDEAINTHYLATDFDKAEAVLTGVVKACEDKCSPGTLAKAWMYVGIVRGSGRNDQAGAKEAFQTALATDPAVKLDAGLATPETQATFANSGGGGAVETPTTPAGGGKEKPAAAEPSGEGISCTPAQLEVETRRHIPVQCKIDEEVTNVELRYKPFGAETWKNVRMEHKGNSFRAQIPCDATQTAGTLKLYVHAKNATGADVVNWGTKTEPIEIQLVEQTSTEAPSFDDADPPPRCAAKEICPPDFPGCDSGGGKGGGTKDWGVQCDNSSECKSGLLCTDGTCETAPSCSTNSDCSVGTCQNGKCAVDSDGGGPSGPAKKWWVGLHFAVDAAFIGGKDICLADSQTNGNWACYWANDTEKPYDPVQMQTKAVGNVGTGAAIGTKRVMLSLDRVLTSNITGGLRLGYAFGGGPPAGKQVTWTNNDEIATVTNAGKAFLPIHAEARVAYWFGKNVFGKKGIRPYVHAGGGVAQVDAKVVVKTSDKYDKADGTKYTADAWKKLGTGFVTFGGGAVYAVSPNWGIQLNLNAMVMLGASGFVLQPSGGLVFGL